MKIVKRLFVENKKKKKEYDKQRYIINRDKILEHQKQYYVKNKEKILEYSKQYSIDNKEDISKKLKEWYTKNRETVLKQQKQYYIDNKEKRGKYTKRWGENNPERLKEYAKQWRKTENGKASIQRGQFKRHAIEKEIINTLTANEWADILEQHNNRCAYCGVEFGFFNRPEREHVMPISKGGNNTKENVVPACRSCNAKKNNKLIRFPYPILVT